MTLLSVVPLKLTIKFNLANIKAKVLPILEHTPKAVNIYSIRLVSLLAIDSVG